MFAASLVLTVVTLLLASSRFWRLGMLTFCIAVLLGFISFLVAAWRYMP